MPVAGAILAGAVTPEDAQAGKVSEGVHLAQRVLQLGILKADSAGNPTAVKTAITKYNKAMKESPAFADRERRAYAEDYKTVFTDSEIPPKNIITPETLVGNTISPVRGDRSNVGQLSQVGGIPVDVPVEGGVKFSRQHGGWASSEGVARGQHNKHIAAAEDTEKDVYGIYNAMGTNAVDFSTPIAEGMMQQIPSLARLRRTDIKAFDKDLRNIPHKSSNGKITYPYRDWVGLDHPDAMSQLMGENGYPSVGKLRTAFSTTMGKAAYRDKGFPTYDELVKAVEDPELSNLNYGDAGHSAYKVDTSQGIQPFNQHRSYDSLMPGEYAGGLEQSVPFEVMFPKMYKKYTESGKKLPRNQAIVAGNIRKDGYEVADQEWLDGVKGFIERSKKLGVAGGGALAAGKLSAEDLAFKGALEEREARKGMSRQERMKNPPSPELRKLAGSEVLPTLGTMAQGALSGAAETIDYLSPVNLARLFADPGNEGLERFFAPSITQNAAQTVKGLTNPLLYDERDPEAEKRKKAAMMVGSLLAPI